MDQYLDIPTLQLKLYNQSWTFEAWIYPKNFTNDNNHVIVTQCESGERDKCFHILIRSQQLYFGQYYDDAHGNTMLTTSRWYHIGFTFNCDTRTISIYLDGVLDVSAQLLVCFQGVDRPLTVGVMKGWSPTSCFDGLIDELCYTNRTRSAGEILRDATLTVHFSFDDNSTYDQGPLRINGSLVGNTTFTIGRVGQALEIQNVEQSYLIVQGLVLYGTSNRPYSFAIWIRPKLQQQSTVVYASASLDGTGWALPVFQIMATSQLISYSWDGAAINVTGPVVLTNSWTHAAVTYSLSSGLKLYVNGTLSDASAPFSYNASGLPMNLFVGSRSSNMGWGLPFNNSDHYCGAVDEFRVYSRELTTGDIVALAHP